MIADVEYLNAKLSKLDGFGDLGEHLLKIVKAKSVTVPPVTETNGASGVSSPIPVAGSSPKPDQTTEVVVVKTGIKLEKTDKKEREKEPVPETETQVEGKEIS